MGYYPQESLYFRPIISTMGTLLGVHPSLSLDQFVGDVFTASSCEVLRCDVAYWV